MTSPDSPNLPPAATGAQRRDQLALYIYRQLLLLQNEVPGLEATRWTGGMMQVRSKLENGITSYCTIKVTDKQS